MKKLLSAMLLIAVLASFAACGNAPAAPAEASSTPSSVSESAAEPASADEPYADQQEYVDYDGEVISIVFDETAPAAPVSGYIQMKGDAEGSEYVFFFSADSTSFGMDIKSVKSGDKLHIRHSPDVTESLPPQSAAIEILLPEQVENSADKADSRLVIADAAMYRGIIEDFAVSDDGHTVLLMRPADGTDFEKNFKVMLTDDTQYSFDSTQMGNGAFLEVFYGNGEKNADGSVSAIAVNDLGDPALANYNGIIAEIIPDPEQKATGSILVNPLSENEMPFEFHYFPDTQFYVDFDSLKVGDKVNVYHSSMATRSIPPQSTAFEFRAYTDNSTGSDPIPVSAASNTSSIG